MVLCLLRLKKIAGNCAGKQVSVEAQGCVAVAGKVRGFTLTAGYKYR